MQLAWRQHLTRLIPILIVYLALAFYGIDHQSLWADEFYSVERVHSTIPIWKDGHGFIYFALLQWWIELGSSEFVLRTLSVLLGTVAVCLMYTFSYALFNQRVTIIGTLLFATSPLLIWYSQEVRYITLVLVVTLLMMYAFQRALARDSLSCWLAYGIATLLALFSFLSTLLLPVAHGIYLLVSPSRHVWLRKWVLCQILVFALFFVWFVSGTHYVQALVKGSDSDQHLISLNPEGIPTGNFNRVTPAVIPWTFFALSVGLSLGPSSRELHAERLAALVPHAPLLFGLAILYVGLILAGLVAIWRRRDAGMFLALWVGVPVMGTFAIAALANLFYDIRYVAMVLPAYVLIVAAGISNFRRTLFQMAVLGAVLAVHGLALANYYTNPKYAREDTRSAARYLESNGRPGDLLLFVGTKSSMPYYYKGELSMISWNEPSAITQTLSKRLQQLSRGHDRLLLVEIRPWQSDPTGKVKAKLDESYDLVEHKHFPGVDIYSYQVYQ